MSLSILQLFTNLTIGSYVFFDDKILKVVDFIPTAENLAKHWFDLIDHPLGELGIKLRFVRVYETPTSTATYEPHKYF